MQPTVNRTLLGLGGIALLAFTLALANGAADEPRFAQGPARNAEKKDVTLQRFMREKLDASSQVLEGLATEDFALIEQGAARMHKLGSAEKWQVSNDAMYRQHSQEFRSVMEKLQKKAQDKNLDGAALTWIEGTMSCLECHKWVRNMIVAK